MGAFAGCLECVFIFPCGPILTWRRLRDPAPKLALALVSLVFSLAVFEVVLRVAPSVIGRQFANGVRMRYAFGPEGIYYLGKDY